GIFLYHMDKDKPSSSFAVRNAFFCEVGIGISADTILLLLHVYTFLLDHLALIHIVMLVAVGFIGTDIFGSQNARDDIKCKSVFYSNRLARGLSICTTCLLSVFQAITLNLRNSCLAKFKLEPSNPNLRCFLLLWVSNMSVSSRYLVSTIATPNVTSGSFLVITESCSLWTLSYVLRYIHFSPATFWDVSLIGLIAVSSGCMVTLLYRHKRQSQHLHSTKLSPETSPEEGATETILLLMRMLRKSNPGLLFVQMLVGNGYATISPFVLIHTKNKGSTACGRSHILEMQPT
uniref:Vomeronasal type-1 receptor n=1 Tax=Bos mutus grunniens TaxID=30521 RepID=A0A8C0AG08_BOSMU